MMSDITGNEDHFLKLIVNYNTNKVNVSRKTNFYIKSFLKRCTHTGTQESFIVRDISDNVYARTQGE